MEAPSTSEVLGVALFCRCSLAAGSGALGPEALSGGGGLSVSSEPRLVQQLFSYL